MIRGPNVKTKFLEKFGNIGYYYIYNKTIYVMKKVIKLTESKLISLIERVLNEYADINGVKIGTNGKGHLTIGDTSYKTTVDCTKWDIIPVYSGPVSIKKIWTSKKGGISAVDNTDKQFTLDPQKSKYITTKMSRGDNVIHTDATGKIKGVEGYCKVKLSKS